MLTLAPIYSVAHDLDRRWMSDDFFDLIVWHEADGRLYGFQLCYDKANVERAFTWTPDGGCQHARVDTGESEPTANNTPVLVRGGSFPAVQIRHEFDARSQMLPTELRELVLSKITAYANTLPSSGRASE